MESPHMGIDRNVVMLPIFQGCYIVACPICFNWEWVIPDGIIICQKCRCPIEILRSAHSWFTAYRACSVRQWLQSISAVSIRAYSNCIFHTAGNPTRLSRPSVEPWICMYSTRLSMIICKCGVKPSVDTFMSGSPLVSASVRACMYSICACVNSCCSSKDFCLKSFSRSNCAFISWKFGLK